MKVELLITRCTLPRITVNREDINLTRNYFYYILMKLEKLFLRRLLSIEYRKLKDAPKVWRGNILGNTINKMNCGWMM